MPDYGNVPEDDVLAVREAVRIAAVVADRISPAAPVEWRDAAYGIVLDGILRDWVQNGTNDLDDEDTDDLANLVRLAVDVSLEQPEPRRSPAFKVICANAMRDWVENWNSDEDDEGFE